jgi:hypothetical protein
LTFRKLDDFLADYNSNVWNLLRKFCWKRFK